MKEVSKLARTVALSVMFLGTSLFAGAVTTPLPANAAAQDFTTICPEMTDSIYRLYTAVFLREPDQAGFDGWVDNYSAQGWHLLRIAQFFTESPEFQERYGSLSDAEFIDLIYQNVLNRLPDAAGREFWIGEMSKGLTRGGLLLFFSESEEYVRDTGTWLPLAGYLRSYTPTTVWGCGEGDHTVLSPTPRQHWDLYIVNLSSGPIEVKPSLVDAAGNVIFEGDAVTLQTRQYFYQWNVDVRQLDPALAGRVHGLRFQAAGGSLGSADVYVVGVGTDRAMPEDRPGWEGRNGTAAQLAKPN